MLSKGTSPHGVNDVKRANEDALRGPVLRLRAFARRTSGVLGIARRSVVALLAACALAGVALPADADPHHIPMSAVIKCLADYSGVPPEEIELLDVWDEK